LKLAATEGEAQTLRTRTRADDRTIVAQKKQIDGNAAAIDAARKQVAELTARATRTQPDLEKLREEVAAAKSEALLAHAAAAQALAAERSAAKAGRSELDRELDAARTKLAKLVDELATIRSSADGQLARMTNRKSRLGRILDGFVTNLIFLSIYIHLSLRMASEGSQIVWVIALLAAVSHSLQSAVADHYRNGYLNFVVSPEKSELDSSAKLSEHFNKLSWSKEPFEKFWNMLYLNYTREQEMISPKFFMLKQKTDRIFDGILPENLRELYKANSRDLVKFYNILTTNTRMIFLFFALLINVPWLYLAFELTILNALLLHVVACQELTCNMIVEKIIKTEEEVEC
jgi:hypothetical protein